MVAIGNGAGRRTVAVLTDMDQPLGLAVGNALEVREALEVLSGGGPEDVREICLVLASEMLSLAGRGDQAVCRKLAEAALDSGAARQKFRDMVMAQGGDPRVVDEPERLPVAPETRPYVARKDGVLHRIVSDRLGMASMVLGAGRRTKDDVIDPASGIVLMKKPGDAVKAGEPIAMLHGARDARFDEAARLLDEAVAISAAPVAPEPLILATVR
jgi:pyrimidine-nucleoside phosphorylase